MKIKKSVNGVQHKAECTYNGLSEETVKRFNKLYAEAAKAGDKND